MRRPKPRPAQCSRDRPAISSARVLLNASLQFAQRFTEAIPVAESLVESAPQEPAHWMNLGTARRGAKQYDAALKAYARAAALGAVGAGLRFQRGAHAYRARRSGGRAFAARGRHESRNPSMAKSVFTTRWSVTRPCASMRRARRSRSGTRCSGWTPR